MNYETEIRKLKAMYFIFGFGVVVSITVMNKCIIELDKKVNGPSETIRRNSNMPDDIFDPNRRIIGFTDNNIR